MNGCLHGLFAITLLVSPLFVGCSAGSDEGPELVNPDHVKRISSDQDDRLDSLGIICESSYRLSGSFTPGAARPAEEDGCWPDGEWTIGATLERKGCDPQADYGAPRHYEVTIDSESVYQYEYPADPNNERMELNVLSHGGPDCEGQFDHYESDFSVWSLRPLLAPDGTISGTGTYSLWIEDAFSN